MEGTFTASSGKMKGSYSERKYDYEILQVDREDGTTISESEKDEISLDDVRESDRIFFTITGGHLGDEKVYRWIGGPYETTGGMEAAIEDMMLYGSP